MWTSRMVEQGKIKKNTQTLEEVWMNGKDGRLSAYRIEIYATSFTLCLQLLVEK
jgi:hypothetical protein